MDFLFLLPFYFPFRVACGFGYSMVVVDRTNVGDRLDQVILLNLHVCLLCNRMEWFSHSLRFQMGFFSGVGWCEVLP